MIGKGSRTLPALLVIIVAATLAVRVYPRRHGSGGARILGDSRHLQAREDRGQGIFGR